MGREKIYNRWLKFIYERFNPFINIPFLTLFFLAHYLTFTNEAKLQIWKITLLYIATILFFFKLRLYDELKDYDYDSNAYPERPLPRGLLTKHDLLKVAVFCNVLELLIFSTFGKAGITAGIFTEIYSAFMFKEFFIRSWIRSHLTIYAVSHTFVSILLSLTLISSLQNVYVWNHGNSAYLFSLVSWFIFNIFEFSRKTFISAEENKDIESYSKIYGRFGASILVLLMATCSYMALYYIFNSVLVVYIASIAITIFMVISILFSVYNKKPWGTIYRIASFSLIAVSYFTAISMESFK